MILLRLITWPYARKHVLRTTLTAAGIVLGVAVFVGMNSANKSVLLAFSRTVDRIAGKTELQVTAGETGFPEEVLEQVQSAASVRIAVPVIEAVTVSVPVMVWLPAVLSVALSVPVPFVSVEFAGSTACPSVLVKCTVPV